MKQTFSISDFDGAIPFGDRIGVRLISVDTDQVVACLGWAPDLCTAGGLLHGGAIMSLADCVGGLLAFVNLPEGAIGTSTISSATQFTRGLRQGTATATGCCLHRGRSTIVIETDVTDDENRLVARVTQTQSVLTP